MSITRYFDLYLNAGKTIPLVINANQYDESEEWVFTLYTDTGVKYTPSSGSIVGIKSDGYLIANAGTVDEQGRVVITETQQMTAAAGKAIFELQIDSETHGTANFIVLVEPDPANNGTVSGSDIGLLRQALNGGLSQSAINALLTCFQNVAWANDSGQDCYDALESALNAVTGISLDINTLAFSSIGSTQQLTATTVPAGGTVSWSSSDTSVATVDNTGLVTSAGYGTATITASSGDVSATCSVTVTQATLVSISAVYTQSGTVYDTDSLDSLKSDLVVTATWSNSSTTTVASADYTLSGTLTTGTSTITVSYGGKTTTFNVTVTANPGLLYKWDLTNSLTDTVSSQVITLESASGVATATRDSTGLHFNAATQIAYLGEIDPVGKTVEIDVSSFSFAGDSTKHVRFLMNANAHSTTYQNAYGMGALIYRNTGIWSSYGFDMSTGSNRAWGDYSGLTNVDMFSGKTVKVVFGSDGKTKSVYSNGTLMGSEASTFFNTDSNNTIHTGKYLYIGGILSPTSPSQSNGDQCYDMTITGIRIYANE